MKRTIAFMLALVLVLSMNLTVSAADPDNGSITINNTLNGVNYKLYKIFDATYKADADDADNDGTKDVVSYTLSDTSPVYTVMFGGVDTVDGKKDNGFFIYDVATGVITKSSAQDAEIIEYLTNMVRAMYDGNDAKHDDCFVANKPATSQTVQFTDLDFGYYLIDTENAEDEGQDKAKIAVTITTNTPDVNVIEKNKAPGELKKEANDESVNIGDTIEWTVEFLATNYDGNDKVTDYTITDTLSSEWAALNVDSVTVKVGGDTLVKDTDYTLSVESTTKFVINIPWLNADGEFLYDPLEVVTITYSATVLEAAANAGQLKNTAELDWNHEGGEGEGDDTESETDVFNMGFTKIDGTTKTGLAGAQFKLYTDISCSDESLVRVEEIADGLYRVAKADENGNIKDDIIKSPADGAVVIQGLAKGTYYLKEIEAPDGYNKLNAPYPVTVGEKTTDGEGNEILVQTTISVNGTSYAVNNDKTDIANNQGIELPSTGGEGTIMMITFGTVVAMAFAILMITQKKMSIYRD